MSITPRQLPLALETETRYSIDDLVVTSANQAAFDLMESWPHWLTPVSIIVGAEGAGKSHLAAVWAAQSFAHSFDPSKLEPAIRAVAEGIPVLIEDIEVGKFDETQLFHLINAVRQARVEYQQSSVLMTSVTRPINWRVALPDLASRLNAVTVVEIAPADDVLLTAVITKLFADRQLAVEPQVVSYIVSRIERSLAFAAKFVALLDRKALEQKTKITKPLVTDVLNQVQYEQPLIDVDV